MSGRVDDVSGVRHEIGIDDLRLDGLGKRGVPAGPLLIAGDNAQSENGGGTGNLNARGFGSVCRIVGK